MAEYCSRHMPEMLQSNLFYKSGDLPKALKQLFVDTDKKLLEKDVIRELKRYVAGVVDYESEVEVDSRYMYNVHVYIYMHIALIPSLLPPPCACMYIASFSGLLPPPCAHIARTIKCGGGKTEGEGQNFTHDPCRDLPSCVMLGMQYKIVYGMPNMT